MGIKGLTKLLSDHASGCMREQKFEGYLDRKVAIDASMHIYQFMMVVGRQGSETLTNDAGEVTSHLQGMFMRTCRMLEAGIKPVYVFDGKPPTMKGGELAKRKDKREAAEAELQKAKDAGDAEMIEKMSKRTVRVSKEQSQEVMKLAQLMGLPVFEAPCEAEATCAALCKAGLAYAAASEDMDTLCFSCPKLARNLMAPASVAGRDPVAPLKDENIYGMGAASVSWHSDSSLKENSTVAVYHHCGDDDSSDSEEGLPPKKKKKRNPRLRVKSRKPRRAPRRTPAGPWTRDAC